MQVHGRLVVVCGNTSQYKTTWRDGEMERGTQVIRDVYVTSEFLANTVFLTLQFIANKKIQQKTGN